MAEALGETFRMRENEAAWRRRVGELEVMLGVRSGAKEGGGMAVVPGAKSVREGDELREGDVYRSGCGCRLGACVVMMIIGGVLSVYRIGIRLIK